MDDWCKTLWIRFMLLIASSLLKNQAHLRQKSSFARFLCKCTKILFKAKNRKSFFSFLSLFFDKAFTQRLDILDAKMKCDDKQPLIPIVKCMRQEYKRNKKEITKADAFFFHLKSFSSQNLFF